MNRIVYGHLEEGFDRSKKEDTELGGCQCDPAQRQNVQGKIYYPDFMSSVTDKLVLKYCYLKQKFLSENEEFISHK